MQLVGSKLRHISEYFNCVKNSNQMKRTLNLKNTLILLTLVLFTTGFTLRNTDNGENVKFYDPVGIWDYEVETDEGTMTGAMTISKDEEQKLEVSVETDQFGTLELDDIELEGAVLTANVELEGDVIGFEFEFDEDSMEGIVTTPDGDLDITAERRKKK